MDRIASDSGRAFLIEVIFDSWEEYEAYYEEACRRSNASSRKRGILKKIIRRYFEVEFKTSLKAPRYYHPEDSESIVLQIPTHGIKTRARGEKRLRYLDDHQHVISTTEMYLRDQLAMRLKIMGVKVPLLRKRRNEGQKNKHQ